MLETTTSALVTGLPRGGRAARGSREAGRWRAYRRTFRRHPVRSLLPVLLALALAAWALAGATPSYQSTSSLWVDNAAPLGSSLDPVLSQAIEPAAEAQEIFTELMTSQAFLNAVGAQSGLDRYLASHATARGFGPAQLVSRLAGRSGSLQQRLDAILVPNVSAVVEGPQVLRMSYSGPTPEVSRATLATLMTDLPLYAKRYGASYAGTEASYYAQLVRADAAELASARWQASNYLAARSRVDHPGQSPYQSLSAVASSYSSQLSEASEGLAAARNAASSSADGVNVHAIDAASLPTSALSSTGSEIETLLAFLVIGLAVGLLVVALQTPGAISLWSERSAQGSSPFSVWAAHESSMPSPWGARVQTAAYASAVGWPIPAPAAPRRAAHGDEVTFRRSKVARRKFALPEAPERVGAPDGRPTAPSTARPRDAGRASRGSTSVVARNLGALTGGQLATWSMTLIWTAFVPRVLGPTGLGYIVSAVAVSGVLGIVLGLGTKAYLVREIVLDPNDAPKLIGSAIILRLLLAPIVLLAAVLFAHLSHYGHEARIVLYLATVMTVLGLLTEPLQAGFQAIERMQYLAFADVINKTAQSLVGIALVFLGFRAAGIMTDMMLAAGLVFLLNLRWLRRFLRVDLRTNTQLVWRLVRQSFVYWAGGSFGMIYLWIDTVMLSLMTTSRVVGWYGATTTLFQTVMFIPVLVSTAWLPRLVRAFQRGRPELMKEARIPFELTLCTGIAIASGTALFAPLVVHTLYGAKYAHAVPVLIILAACLPWIYLNIILYSVMVALKRAFVWTFVMLGAAIVNPLFNLVLIRITQNRLHNGALGAAASLVLTEFIMDLIGLTIIGRGIFTASMLRRLAAVTVSSAGMLATDYLLAGLGQIPAVAAALGAFVVLSIMLRAVTIAECRLFVSHLQAIAGRKLGRRRPERAAVRV